MCRILSMLVVTLMLAFSATNLAAQAKGLSDDARFVASSRGSVYYPRSCDAWTSLSPSNLIGFETEAEAKAASYRRTTNKRCGWSEAAPPRSAGSSATATPPAATRSGAEMCTVSRVYDGDTVTCRSGERIRLLLIDTPEMDQGPFGREARTALLRLIPLGTTVRVEHDVERQDRYGRTLGYLWLPDGRIVNEELARAGYALSLTYPPNVRHVDRIRAAVEDAKAARRGLWARSGFSCEPRDHRAGRCE